MTDSSRLLRPLSRRRLLQGGVALGAGLVLGEACGSSTPTGSPAASTLARGSASLSPSPVPSTPALALTEDLLRQAQGPLVRLFADATLPLPGGGTARASDLEAAGTALDASTSSPSFFPNPIAALGLALAAADWTGEQGVLDLSATLPGLALQVVRLALPGLPGNDATDTLAAAAPPDLVLRPGTALLLAGVLPDGRVVTGIADPARQLQGHPRLELALLAPATLSPLLALVGATLEGATVSLPDGRHVTLASVDPAFATTLATATGACFVDTVPLLPKGAKPALTADPVVPTPDATVVTGAASVARQKDGRILALDAGGKAVGRAEYIGGTSPWDWLGADGLDWTLREEADEIGWRVGVEMTGWLFGQEAWQRIVRAQFNQGLLSWGVNWNEVEPTRGQFDFGVMDRLVAFAEANAMRVRVDSIVFGHTAMLPAWLLGGRFSARELTSILENHVSTIVEHYRGRVAEWVVCNEPYVAPYSTDDLFYASLGYDYIPLAFAAARRADPGAMLNFSDSYNHTAAGITTALTHEIVARLRARKLIDVVGLQGHVDAADPPDPADVTATMRSYGMPVEVTSFDIDLSRISGTLAQRYALQGRVATSMLAAARASGVCQDFSVWGIGDGFADRWLDRPGAPAPMATPFDANLKPKPFFAALLRGFA